MGNQPSHPRPGTPFRVIGAGLPRTGTASFSAALRILLAAPVYHGGTQTTLGPLIEIRSWIQLLSHYPPQSPADKTLITTLLHERLDGYAAATDAPASGLVPELLAAYPDAIVICTVRDPEAWERSMARVAGAATMWALRGVLLPLPGMRHWVDYIGVLRKQWWFLYADEEPPTRRTYERHVEWLREVVPPERLVFFDVREGWEPLCRVLGVAVPALEFPRVNDGEAIERFAREVVVRGLKRWLVIVLTVGVGVWAFRLMRG